MNNKSESAAVPALASPDQLEKATANARVDGVPKSGHVDLPRESNQPVPWIDGETYGEHAERCGVGPCLRCVGKSVSGPEGNSDGSLREMRSVETHGTQVSEVRQPGEHKGDVAAASRAGETWQPMASAQRCDRPDVLVSDGVSVGIGEWCDCEEAGHWIVYGASPAQIETPTHWLPLPDPPQEPPQ